jgi:hypothetical protein
LLASQYTSLLLVFKASSRNAGNSRSPSVKDRPDQGNGGALRGLASMEKSTVAQSSGTGVGGIVVATSPRRSDMASSSTSHNEAFWNREDDHVGSNCVRARCFRLVRATRGLAGVGAGAAKQAIVFISLSTGFPRFSAQRGADLACPLGQTTEAATVPQPPRYGGCNIWKHYVGDLTDMHWPLTKFWIIAGR